MMNKIEVRAERRDYMNKVDLAIFHLTENGRSVAGPLTLNPINDADPITPTVSLGRDEAQFLMDQLWHCGLRPTEGSGSAGSLAATERHLKDLQGITTALLKKSGIEV